MNPLLRGAAGVLMLAFAVQGLSTSAKRLWAPTHYHLEALVPASTLPPATAASTGHMDTPAHAHGNVPVAGHDSRAGHDHGGHYHDDPQADAEATAWAQANTAVPAARFGHPRRFDLNFGGADHVADTAAVDGSASRGSAPRGNAGHQHSAGSGHRHALAQPGVVYVDAGVDSAINQNTPAVTAAGFDAYWSIVPPGLQLVLQRLRAPPPGLTQLSHASRRDGPPERPPRG